MLQGSDGAYYGFVNIAGDSEAESGVAPGNCAFRTDNLAEPKSYRGWNGSAFTIKWRSPYLPEGSLGAGKCTSFRVNETSFFDAHVCLRRFVDGANGMSIDSTVLLYLL